MSESRTISVDPGLLSPEELLSRHEGGRRKSLEGLIEKQQTVFNDGKPIHLLCRQHMRWFLDSARLKISYDDFMTITAIFVLFGDWIRILSFPPSADSTFDVLYNIALALFILELSLNSWVKSDFSGGIFRVKGYMFSFFFWLDLICIISIIPDLQWAASVFGGGNLSDSSGVGAKAGQAGKIGAKTGRVVRMARLVRLVKLYKITSQRKRERKLMEDLGKLIEMGHLNQKDVDAYAEKMRSSQKQSKVGSELSDIITRRVIIAVLLMLLVVPLLSYTSSIRDEVLATEYLQFMNIQAHSGISVDCDFLTTATNEFLTFMESIIDSRDPDHKYLLYHEISPNRCALNETTYIYDPLDFRMNEIREIEFSTTSTEGITYSVTAVFNMKYFIQEEAKAGIYLTLFVTFMLVTLSIQFTGDAQKLILAPIESMMEMIEMVARDPLEDYDFSEVSRTGEYETKVVQLAIQRITALLRIGFGVAGAEIISTNMAVEGEGTGVFEPMVPGKRIYAIFGFCDIHSFDLCTNKLEDEIMTFVNVIARIVHSEVTRWGGLCNKNLGNAFFMVWRIGDENALQVLSGRRKRKSQMNALLLSPTKNSLTSPRSNSMSNMAVDLRRIPGLDIVADKALVGFLKVLVEINRDLQIIGYRNDKRLAGPSSPFKVRMGFGLHAGWAIEGAVGSLQKVDATYLSPHVNMAARMEAASKQFGVAILMTERFHELMTPEAQSYCRKLDVVTVKGSSVPIPIFTYDTHQDQIFPRLRTPKYSNLDLAEVLKRQADDYDVLIWENDLDLVQLRRLATQEFLETYRKGLDYYLAGDWQKAKEMLQKSNEMMKESESKCDGPSQTLLSFMESNEWTCPPDWKGFRALTIK